MSVHILGAGAMGSLVAHELALGSRIAPILLLRTSARLDAYNQAGLAMSVLRQNGGELLASRVAIPALCRPPVDSQGRPQHIDHIVVATKAHAATAALKPYVKNLLSNSTVMLLQNGMGVAGEMQKELWPHRKNMPVFYQAISTHGAYKLSPTAVNHVGFGALTMARLPETETEGSKEKNTPRSLYARLGVSSDSAGSGTDSGSKSSSPSSESASGSVFSPECRSPLLIEALLQSGLNASCIPYRQFLLRQMEKLVANACINPLSAVLDCFNGDLLLAPKALPLMKRVVRECVDCFRAEYPDLAHIPDAATYLDKDRLLAAVLDLCRTTANNSSSMREDLRRLHRTEIDWINGYIVRLGYTHRIPTPTNRMLMELVQSKLAMERAKENMALARAKK